MFADKLKYKIIDETGCWEWSGSRYVKRRYETAGYGRLGYREAGKRKSIQAHRLSWMLHFGPIPEDMCVCHTCDNPPCVNPDHLWLGTHTDNVRDMKNKGRGPRGEKNGKAKLTEATVTLIHKLYERRGVMNQRRLAKMFEVDIDTIRRVISGRAWTHVASALLCALFLSACTVGYASPDRAFGIAVGQSRLASCNAEEGCPEVRGGQISEPFSDVFGRLIGAVVGAVGGAFGGAAAGASSVPSE